MTDFEHIVPLWRELESSGADYVLATVVAVEGSSYRGPGARMLLSPDGRRAGTVSGGCLEAAVAKKAWWLTTNGPVVERYSTLDDDGDLPYGSGCGGIVYILLERRKTASPLLHALHAAFLARAPLSIATILEGAHVGERAFASPAVLPAREMREPEVDLRIDLQQLADAGLHRSECFETDLRVEDNRTRIWVDYRAARPGLWIFGAGDDVKPVLHLARELGWFVAVADGRAHLATAARFSTADQVMALSMSDLPGAASAPLDLHPTDAAVLMTHSFEQDSRILATLLDPVNPHPLAYTGVLGPQRRTREALVEAARILALTPTTERIEAWLEQLHAPMGLDLGADTPASIALSILSEIQKTIAAGSALPLREVRATGVSPIRS